MRTRLLAVKLLKVILPGVSEETFEEDKDVQVYLVFVVVLLSGLMIARKPCSKELPFPRTLFPFPWETSIVWGIKNSLWILDALGDKSFI